LEGQSCVVLPYLDDLDWENWECRVLERRDDAQKRDSQKEEVVLETKKGAQEVKDEDCGWRKYLGSREMSQRSECCMETKSRGCLGTLAGCAQKSYLQAAAWQLLTQLSAQLPWLSIHLPCGDWRLRESGVAGEVSEQVR